MKIGTSRLASVGNGFRALGSRNYRLFWSGSMVSLAGTWMQDVALSWLVLSLTESPIALGLTMTFRFLPSLLFALYGGVLADRLPKRKTIITAQCIQLAVALALATLTSTGLITVAIIYALAAVRGMVEAVDSPTRQAFVPEMVGSENLANAIALNSMLFNGARIVGPAVGAIVISAAGIAACFYLNAASFVAVIAGLLAMRPGELQPTARAHIKGEKALSGLAEGFRYAVSTPDILMILIILGAIGTFGYNFQVLLPLVAKYVVGSGVSGLALLTTSMGIGSVVAGLIVAYRGKASRRLLFGAAGAFSVLLMALAFAGSQIVSAGLMFAIGVCGVLFMTTANTRLQLLVPNHLRGRVMGMYVLLFMGTTPIGSAIIGQLAEHVGVRETVAAMAALCIAGVGAAFIYLRRKAASNGGARGLISSAIPAEARGRSVEKDDILNEIPGSGKLI